MDVFELAAKITLDDVEYLQSLRNSEEATQGFGSKAKNILGNIGNIALNAVKAATSATVGFVKDSITVGQQFDTSMSQVAATMGKSVDEIQNLRDFAQEMGATTAFSATQAADALNYMALAGYDAQMSMNMLPNVLNLAAAGGIDLAYASDMVTDASSALGLSTNETAELVDKMASAASSSNTSVAQLGEAILQVGGTAKTLSGGTTELATALGVLADNGVKGAEGGTALRNIILSLSAPTDKAAGVLTELGVNAFDAEGKMLPLADVMAQFNAALEPLTEQEKTQALNNIFNKVDLKSVNAMLATSADRWTDLSNKIQKGVKLTLDTKGLREAYKNIGYVASSVDDMQKNFKKLGVSETEFNKALEDSNYNAETFLENILAAADAGTTLEDVLNSTVGDTDELQMAFDSMKSSAEAMANTQLDNLAGDITMFGSALEGARIIISDGIMPQLRDFVQFGTEGIQRVTNAFREGGLSSAFEEAGSVISDGLDLITGKLPTAIDGISVVLGSLLDGIGNNAEQIGESLAGAIESAVALVSKNAPTLLDSFGKLILSVLKGLEKKLPTLVPQISKLISDVVGWVTSNAGEFTKAALSLVKALGEGIKQSMPVLKQVLPTVMENVAQFIEDTFPDLVDTIISVATMIIENIDTILIPIIEALPDFIGRILDALTDEETFGKIIDGIVNCFDKLGDALPGLVGSIMDALPKIIDKLINSLLKSENIEKMISGGVQLFFGLVKDIDKLVNEIAPKLPDFILQLAIEIGKLAWKMMKAGRALMEGLWDGIKAAFPDISAKLEELFQPWYDFFEGIGESIGNFLGGSNPEYGVEDVANDITAAADVLLSKSKPTQADYTAYNNIVKEQMLNRPQEYEAFKQQYGDAYIYMDANNRPIIEATIKLDTGVELGRAVIDSAEQARRVDGYRGTTRAAYL